METQEEEVHTLQKICSQGNHLMEAQEKEDVPFCKIGIRVHPKRSVAEKSSRLETEEEKGLQFK